MVEVWRTLCGFMAGKDIFVRLLEILNIAHGPLLASLWMTGDPIFSYRRDVEHKYRWEVVPSHLLPKYASKSHYIWSHLFAAVRKSGSGGGDPDKIIQLSYHHCHIKYWLMCLSMVHRHPTTTYSQESQVGILVLLVTSHVTLGKSFIFPEPRVIICPWNHSYLQKTFIFREIFVENCLKDSQFISLTLE